MFSLSQGHLTLLDACARKFRHVFLDALSSPSSYEQKAKTQWGAQFHLLMQQRSLGLPIEVMSAADAEMAQRLDALAEAAPEVFEYLSAASHQSADKPTDLTGISSQSEQKRSLAFNGYLLTVVYDLVVKTPTQGQLFDWKTHQQPPRKDWLQNDWQTRLYLYVLAETTDLPPEQLSMTYCFVRIEPSAQPDEAEALQQPSFYRFEYSQAQHERTRRDLQMLTDGLTKAIAKLEAGQAEAAFPKVDESKGLCDRCPFNIRCDRAPSTFPTANSSSDPYQMLRAARQIAVEAIEEIPL